MEREKLVQIRNEIISAPIGAVLFEFMHDYAACEAVKGINAEELKGMLKLIHKIKNVPNEIK